MRTRAFIVLWIAMAVAMAGIGMVSPLLPIYVRQELHGPELAVALSFSGLALTQIIASPFFGRLADRIGPKPFIILGFAIYACAGFGYVFADSWEKVIAFRLLSGIGAASIFPNALAYIGRLAPRGREGAYMGVYAVAEVAGFGIGPLLGGAARDLLSSRAAFASMSLLLTATGLLTLLALPARARRVSASAEAAAADEAADERDAAAALPMLQVAREPLVQALIVARCLVSLGWGAGATYLAIFIVSAEGLNTGSATFVGLLFASRALLGSIVQPIAGRFADRMDRTRLIVGGLCLSALAQFLIPDLPRTTFALGLFATPLVIAPWMLVVYLVAGLGDAIERPAESAIFVEAGRRVGMASVMSLNQTASAIGFLSGSLLGAGIVGEFGLAAPFRAAGAITFLGAMLFMLLVRRARASSRASTAEPAHATVE
jgi:DHA1 family multidrug resistance protein-like MFS transporter